MLRRLTIPLLALLVSQALALAAVAQTGGQMRRSSGAYTAPASSESTVSYDDVPVEGEMTSSDWAGSCSDGTCGPECGICRPLGGSWARLEMLLWTTRGMNVPALVTTSNTGTARNIAGVLGEGSTRVLYGDDTVNSYTRIGGRFTGGVWLDECRRLGIEGDYFGLENETENYNQNTAGNAILARPFYDIVNGQETAQLVSFPNVISGSVNVDAVTKFQGSGIRFINNLCGAQGCCPSILNNCNTVPTSYQVQMLLGYRYLRLDDSLEITEDLTSLDTAAPGSFFVRDMFETDNQFHGGDIGFVYSTRRGCWSLDILSKVAIGSTYSRISIDGNTLITEGNQTTNNTGGLLAQRTNIGDYTANEFAMVPELGLTLGYQLNPCWRFTMGYTLLYWSRVARAGDQIDTDINPNLIPPEDPAVTTHLRPEFNLAYTDFWGTGLNLGLEATW